MLTPSLFALGAGLASVPIIIHLLNRQRFRPVQWAAMEFLLNAVRKNSRRLQLRDLLMLLIRTLAVLLLGLALARPSVSGRGPFGGTKTAAVILLDNSMSMAFDNGSGTRFDAAKRMVKNILAQLEPGSWCALYTFNDDVLSPLGDPTSDMAYIEMELDRSILISDGATNVEKALLKAKTLLDTKKEYQIAARELYIVTDMQSRAWNPGQVSANFKPLLAGLGKSAAVFVINAGGPAGENAAIVDFAPTDAFPATGLPVAFVARIRNFGQNALKGVPVDLYVNATRPGDKPAQRATVDVPAGETASVTFEATFAQGGDQKVEVRLADDRLLNDNRRFCTVEVADESRILLVDGRDSSGDPSPGETSFLKFALSPTDPENPGKQGPLATETVGAARMADRNLLNYQAIVLANVARIPQGTAAALERQVKAGTGLMIFLGDQTDAEFLNQMLGEGGAKLLPGRIGGIWSSDAAGGGPVQPASFSTARLSHPLMAEFNNPDFGAEFLSAVKVTKCFEIEPLKDDNVRVVAWLTNGKPAIVERRVGTGVVLLFAFPPTKAWGNMPLQPVMPVLLNRAAALLAQGNRPSKNLPVTTPIHGTVAVSDQNTTVRITPPPPFQRRETRPERTTDGRAAFDYTETERAGFYDVVLDRTPKVSMTYALSPNAEHESNLDAALPETLRTNYPEFDFSYIASGGEFQKALQNERRGTELWPYLIAAVFGLLVLESVLANRWAPRD